MCRLAACKDGYISVHLQGMDMSEVCRSWNTCMTEAAILHLVLVGHHVTSNVRTAFQTPFPDSSLVVCPLGVLVEVSSTGWKLP